MSVLAAQAATPMQQLDQVRVGLVGSGFMAKTHSLAYRSAGMLYADELPPVVPVRVADLVERLARDACGRYGWSEPTTDWRTITRAGDIDLVDIVTPNFAHAEIAIDAARHGKHVLCEKPLANRLDAAQEMYRAVRDAGVVGQVGFVFRHWPAMQLARRLIRDGRIGRPLRFRAHYFHDYALDPDFPVSWRLRNETSGGGSVADLGSHLFDLARYLIGDIDRVLCRSRTIVPRRPDPDTGEPVDIDVDDASDVLLEFAGGVSGVIETNWMAAGYKTDLAFEVTGDGGSVRFSWENNGELQFYDAADPGDLQGFRTIIAGPQHSGADGFWPVAGQGLGYGDAFVILLRNLLHGLGGGDEPTPTFLDGLRAAEILDSAQRSAGASRWTEVTRMPVEG